MPPGRQKLRLGDSWVVEGEDKETESPEYLPKDEESEPSPLRHSTRRPPRATDRSPEPELVMPSLDASWADSSSRSVRRTRSAEKEARRRAARQGASDGTPVKHLSKKVAHKSEESRPTLRRAESSHSVQDILELLLEHTYTMAGWMRDVVGGALRLLKTPISYLLAVWLLFGLGVICRTLITNSVYASLSPICRIPGAGLLNLPFCPVHRVDARNGPPPPVEFDQLMTVQAQFEEVLEESAGGVSLPMDMKRGEASIRDLRQLVRYSQLYSNHVGRAVDSVIATTRWTTRVLDGIQERDATKGLMNAFINDKILAPFQPVKFTEGVLLDQYIQHTRLVEEEIHKLISEAQAILMVLNNLEDRLEVIHGVATRDGMHAKALKEEILSELWTMVGGNRGKLNKMDRQLSLLQHVGVYRKTAYAHISGTILRLQAIGAGLEDLRERVGAPELLRDRAHVPLSVHIENIQLGVERLESSRQNARKLENEHIKQTLERGQSEGPMIDGEFSDEEPSAFTVLKPAGPTRSLTRIFQCLIHSRSAPTSKPTTLTHNTAPAPNLPPPEFISLSFDQETPVEEAVSDALVDGQPLALAPTTVSEEILVDLMAKGILGRLPSGRDSAGGFEGDQAPQTHARMPLVPGWISFPKIMIIAYHGPVEPEIQSKTHGNSTASCLD
ncbi:hypothetical protein D0Z07_0909 [Hyphodiscus hymeniophilus]|uniref:Uncharacterized protein n=1 Tax=Hyphodiscus hymeniophilus TaxID=353542 RepID=A0A9P6VP96_9HELO|nr:hypothetical protein D0Z07_0909 [Hyphodiscus hymeniophilus]